jgi:hypothetical protein
LICGAAQQQTIMFGEWPMLAQKWEKAPTFQSGDPEAESGIPFEQLEELAEQPVEDGGQEQGRLKNLNID